jgi:hypothetical protein
MATSPFISKNTSAHEGNLKGSSGELIFQQLQKQTALSENAIDDRSFVQLSQVDGAGIKFEAGGKTRLESPTDLSTNAGKNSFEAVLGSKQTHVGSNVMTNVEGDIIIRVGKQGKEEYEAVKQLQSIQEQVVQRANQAAASATDDWTPCPLCNQKALEDTKSGTYIAINKNMRMLEKVPYVGPWWKWPAWLFSKTSGILSAKPHISYNSKKSCSAGCKNGMIQTPQKTIQAYNEGLTKSLDANQSAIEEQQIKMGSGGNVVLTTKGGIVINAGLVKNQSDPYLEKGKHTIAGGLAAEKSSPMFLSGRGSPKRVIKNPAVEALDLAGGDIYLNVSKKFTVNAGSDGIDLHTSGGLESIAGHVEIKATKGEAHFGSGNLTVIHGEKVLIQATAADGSVSFDAKNVHFPHSASVVGSLDVKGAINSDGPLSVPFLRIPSMTQQVTESAPTQMATGEGNFVTGIAGRMASFAKDNAGKLVFPPTWIADPDHMVSYVQELYDIVRAAVFVNPIPSGYCMVWSTGGCTWGGFVVTFGLGIVWNYYHNHNMFSMESAGQVTLPLMEAHDTVQGVNSHRGVGSPVPMPPPGKSSIGIRPGPASLGGPCGGGGSYSKQRNTNYGVDPENTFTGDGYVDRYTYSNRGIRALSSYNVYPQHEPDLLPPVTDGEFSNWKYGVLPSLTGCNTDCLTP